MLILEGMIFLAVFYPREQQFRLKHYCMKVNLLTNINAHMIKIDLDNSKAIWEKMSALVRVVSPMRCNILSVGE